MYWVRKTLYEHVVRFGQYDQNGLERNILLVYVTAFEKAFENMTPEQRRQATEAIGEMMGISPNVRKNQASLKSPVYLEREDLQENIVVIKINQLYWSGMSEEALYEVTRGIWKRNLKSLVGTEYCLSVYKGIVVEVYQIDKWNPAGTTPMKTRNIIPEHTDGRVEFIGKVAPDEIRDKYIGRSVAKLYKPGEANPVKVFRKN